MDNGGANPAWTVLLLHAGPRWELGGPPCATVNVNYGQTI